MKYFFDTNILVYMQDASDLSKRSSARSLLAKCVAESSAVISTQCLQEFYSISTGKFKQDKNAAKAIIQNFAEHLQLVQISYEIINSAINLNIENQLSIWDALIVASVQSAYCDVLYSEDLQDGQTFGKTKICNPFVN